MIYVFTSAAVNYLPKVRLLFSSIKHHHPEFQTCLVLVDKVPAWFKTAEYSVDKVIELADLDIPNRQAWIFQHSIVELCTGVKGYVLSKLLKAGDCQAVLYFDPDMVVFSPLVDLLAEFEKSSILLTPHQTKHEESMEAIKDNEICSLQCGVFNLGFLGVNNDEHGREFADWWRIRLEHFCFDDRSHGVFVDQKWIDFVPVFFEGVKILKSPRFNVATWNVTTRKVSGSVDEQLLVDGQPLGFYHFTGFDSGACRYMANKYAGDNAAIMGLVNWYEDMNKRDRVGEDVPWAYGQFENGKPVTSIHRLVYNRRPDLQASFPDPYLTSESDQSYYFWFEKYARKELPELFEVPKRNSAGPGNYLMRALTSSKDRKYFVQKAWSIFKKEGFTGLRRALNS